MSNTEIVNSAMKSERNSHYIQKNKNKNYKFLIRNNTSQKRVEHYL